MKKIGIVADNYKLEKFKEELIKAGFDDFKILPFVNNTSTITLRIPDDRVFTVKTVCELVETHFKRSN
jgi:hypothetical protein